jgi:hypothetical protein
VADVQLTIHPSLPSLSVDLVAATAVAVGFAADAAKEEAPSEY